MFKTKSYSGSTAEVGFLGLTTGKIRLPKISIGKGPTLAEVAPHLSPTTKSVLAKSGKAASRTAMFELMSIAAAVALKAATVALAKRAADGAKSPARRAA